MKRISLLAFLFALLCSCAVEKRVCRPAVSVKHICKQPESLKKGDRVALISPAYYAPMEDVVKAADVLLEWGFEPVIGPNVGKIADGKYAGTVDERLSDIRWAFRDSSIKAIICNRGGYGTIQLIGNKSLPDFKAFPKWLVGFSDITTLHGLLTRSGVMSVHGTVGSHLAEGGNDETCTLMRDILLGKIPEYSIPAHPWNIVGTAEGVLVGGNLCTFVPNLGTEADAAAGKDLILFIEEVGESMHNIDRQMRVLQMNGVLDRCKGVILGEFSDCRAEFTGKDGGIMSAEQMIHAMLKQYKIPLLCGFPAGHGEVNLPLVMGAPVMMKVTPEGSSLSFCIGGGR